MKNDIIVIVFPSDCVHSSDYYKDMRAKVQTESIKYQELYNRTPVVVLMNSKTREWLNESARVYFHHGINKLGNMRIVIENKLEDEEVRVA